MKSNRPTRKGTNTSVFLLLSGSDRRAVVEQAKAVETGFPIQNAHADIDFRPIIVFSKNHCH